MRNLPIHTGFSLVSLSLVSFPNGSPSYQTPRNKRCRKFVIALKTRARVSPNTFWSGVDDPKRSPSV